MKARNPERKNVVIVGSYRLEKAIAVSLMEKGCSVTAINDNPDECQILAEIKDLKVINGDGTRRSVLEDADISSASILIAVTDSDDKNLVISEMAKRFYKVKKTVALLDDGEKSTFFHKMGVDRVISPLNMVSAIMEEETTFVQLEESLNKNKGRMIIGETPVSDTSRLRGKKLWELNLPKTILICSILRGDENIIPRGDTTIKENDVLLVLSTDQKAFDCFVNDAAN